SNSYEGLDIVDTQIQQNGLSFEVALAPGEYVLYMHGGTYQPQNVPATGTYWLEANSINEMQAGCLDFNTSWVSKGAELSAAISGDDCLDEFGDPDRLFDSYAIWLEQGESVTVSMEAEIATQILSFNENSFIAATPFTAANTKHGLTVTAADRGWHRFAAYTTNNNPTETGAYTIRFIETPVFGDAQACTQNLAGIGLGQSTNGALNSEADCFFFNRLSDRYLLTLNESTLFRADVTADGFNPLLALYRAGNADQLLASRGSATASNSIEFYLAAGQYWLSVTTNQTALDTAPQGSYTLGLTSALPLSDMQTTGCPGGNTRLVIGGPTTLTGEVAAGDCQDSNSTVGVEAGSPEYDGYQLVIPEGAPELEMNLNADFAARLSVWRAGQFVQFWDTAANQSLVQSLTSPGSYQIYVLGQQGPESQAGADRGTYSLTLTPQLGITEACTNLPAISLDSSLDGSLNAASDCYVDGRLSDRYQLTLNDTTLFRVSQINNAFMPFTAIYNDDGSRLLGSRLSGGTAVYTEYLLPAGQYQLEASSRLTDGFNPPQGNYTLQLSAALPLSDIQTNPQFGPTRLVPQGTINAALADTDAVDPVIQDGVTRYIEGYSFAVPDGESVTVTLQSSFPHRFVKWVGTSFSNLTLDETDIQINAANAGSTKVLEGPANYLLYVLGDEDGITGNYSLSFNDGATVTSQRDALLALYNATGGANWNNNDGWLGEPGTECNWHGVSCQNGLVTQIDLGGNNLVGTLPAELGSLSSLTGLWLWDNRLEGTIPSSLGNLSNLEYLDLSANLLSGQVPASLANLSNAQSINLRNNLLDGDVPQAVLDMGIVNLWANIDLNLPKGDPAACAVDDQITVGGSIAGELTPFTDCYVESENVMADFYQLDLTGAEGTTLIRVEGDSQAFWPHMGIIGAEGIGDRDIVERQVGEPPYTFEAALAPGEYTIYFHGGVYNHDKNVDVPATGTYTLSVTAVNELQAGCRDFNNTWVTKGVELNSAISSDDCLDTFNEPNRLTDSYAIYLEQGESVTVTMEAEIATQILSFNQAGFITAAFGPANTKYGLTVTATQDGWHRFAPYTTNNNPLETGAYTIRFIETPDFGVPEACTQNLPELGLGGQTNGALDNDTDCFEFGRLRDYYRLNISEPTLLRAEVETDVDTGYMPMLGITRAFNSNELLGSRVGIDNTVTLEAYLAPGQYWLFASSRFTALDTAIEGNYTLNLSQALPIEQMQTGGCEAGDTRLVLGGPLMIEGGVGEGDCTDSSQFGEAAGFPERDSYQLVVPEGSLPVQIDLQASFNARLAVWSNGQPLATPTVDEQGQASYTINGAGSYQINVLGQQGPGNGTPDRGSYQLAITPLVGNETACSNVPTINLSDSINSTLDRLTDCYRNGRMTDRYLLELEETTLFRVQQSSQGFAPLTGVMAAEDQSRVFGTRISTTPVNGVFNVYTEYLLPAGQYWVFASSVQADGLLPPVGSYTLNLSLPLQLSDIQTNPQFGPTRLVPQGTINGELSNTDAMDLFAATAEQQRYLDAYSFAVAANERVTVTLQAGYPILLSKWQGTSFSNLQYVEAQAAAANEEVSYELVGPANYIMYAIGNADGVTGPYTITFDDGSTTAAATRTALEAVYNATGGANWTNSTNWLSTEVAPCDWFGVHCNQQGALIGLELPNNNLSGELPSELWDTASLQFLTLRQNNLSGSFPDAQTFAALTQLSGLDLGGNDYSGALPASLGSAGNLRNLFLWSNQFSGPIPAEWANLTELQYLSLGSNNTLSGSLPAFLGDLSNLQDLDLAYNAFTGEIPAELGNLSNATSINLRSNQLSGAVPQSVLNMGAVVNLWANPGLTGLALGSQAACDVQTPLAVGERATGELTPFTDCYFEEDNIMADFFSLDLSGATGTTLLRIEAYSDFFYPHVGVLDSNSYEGLDIVDTQIQQNGLSFEVALAPGEYVLYMHGGTYQPQNVPATGEYWLQTSQINELQVGCLDFNNTWVTKGAELNGAISSDDCLDTFNDPDRLFDSYTLWLEQGESVTVIVEAEIATQTLSFNQTAFITAASGPANTKYGLTVTATQDGWHRFAPYTTNNNPTETGAYTIRFIETPEFGVPEACTQNLPELGLGGQTNGALDSDTDCFEFGRLRDYYRLNISEPTLLRAEVETDVDTGYMPMLGITRAFNSSLLLGSRVGIDNTVVLETYLAPGQYWLFASSRFTALDEAIEGNYSLSLSQALPIEQMQTGGCEAGDTRLVLGGPTVINGEVGQGDCFDSSQFGELDGFPERDSYQLVLPEGSPQVEVEMFVDFNARFAVWRNGQILEAVAVDANGDTSYTLNGAGTYQINVLGQQGSGNGGTPDRGNYSLGITPLAGNELSCADVPTINLGDSVNGTLDRLADCYRNGRMTDRYLLELEETTLFRVQQSSQGFAPLTGVMAAEEQSRVFGTRISTMPVNGSFNVYTEYLLPAGQYWVFATSAPADGLLPPVGSYTLNLSLALPLSDIQTNPQFGPTRLVPQGTIQGELANSDGQDLFAATEEDERYLDAYSFAVAADERITVTLQAGYPVLLSKWQGTNFSNLQYVEAQPAAANTSVSYELEGPANYIMYVIGNENSVTGPYTISFATEVLLPYVAPAGSDATITLNEDQAYSFSENDFGFSDEDGNAFTAVRISSLPAAGSLALNSIDVVEGQEIDVASLPQLVFSPAANAFGSPYASFTFQVRDDGLDSITGRNGSVDLDPSPNTIQVNVNPVNDAPIGSGNDVTLNAITSFAFSVADFGFSDPNDLPANLLQAVRIVALPNAGALLLNSDPVVSGQIIPADELANLSYEPPAELVSPFLVAFTYQVQDNGGTANGGVDTDSTARSFSITVVIEPPVTPPPTTGGGGGTPTPEQVADEINDLDNELQVIESVVVQPGQPVSQEVVNQVGTALERTNTLAQQVTTALPAGTEGVNLALNALNTMSRTLTASATVSAGGGSVSNTAATSSINSVATVLTALSTRSQDITPEQRATVQNLASTTVSNSSNLIRAGSSNDELVSMVAATSAVINAASAAGGQLTTELVAQAEALVTKAVKTGISSFAPGINVDSPAEVENLLRTNPQALEFAIDASVAVKSRIQADNTAVQQELANRGLDTVASERLTNVLTAVSNPDGVTVAGSSASEVLLSALVQFLTGGSQSLQTIDGRQVFALSTGGIELTVDALTGTVMIKAPGETYSAAVVNTRIVSSSVPEGLSFMRDGRALIVASGVAMELAPIAVDLVGFTSLVESAGYEMSLRERGAIHVSLSTTDTFVGVFAYDNLANSAGSCGTSTLIEPVGEPNSAGYSFGVKCSNGVNQKIVPYVHDPVFYRSVTDYGLTLTTDRNTASLPYRTLASTSLTSLSVS
ncbi:MAG: hypothetical protein CMQ46_10580, partial [Gammaproteobacteria bacterium]|nr:hypothetical protein [Gammaproteobacteria bacterium]